MNKKEQLPISLLYVEDDKVLQNVYKHILEKLVTKIYFASNGQEGYEIFKEKNPDLVITDIRMPVMNGLDMIKKIKRLNDKARIIILSAYGESRYFLQAIELGVKGFLLKPADNKKLTSLVREQVEAIRIDWKIKWEEEQRRNAEQARIKSEAILKALVDASARFFHFGFTESSILPALKAIGRATNSSRIYIFENHQDKEKLLTSQTYEWVAEGIEKQIDNPALKNLDLGMDFLSGWVKTLQQGKIIFEHVEDIENHNLRAFLEMQQIKSIVLIPIYVNNRWWGFVGLDDCVQRRNWSVAEIKALQALANNLGAAIYRKNVELELLRLNATLEDRVKQRTRDLETEIAERRLTEMLLRDSEEKYRLIFENANSAIVLVRDGEIVLVNPKTVDIFKLLPKEMIGRPLSRFFTEPFNVRISNCFEIGFSKESCSAMDACINTVPDEARWVEIKSNKIVWDNKDSFLLFISDITARKKAEEELNRLNKSLEQRIREKVEHLEKQQQLLVQKSKLESMGELSAGLAHEINQPLLAISMGLDNILMKISDQQQVDYQYIQNKFKFLFEDIERINKIIRHVRIFSREQGQETVSDVDVNKVVTDALSMTEMQLKNHQVLLDLQLADDPPVVLGNTHRLEQVLLNLISNARQAVDFREKKETESNYIKRISIKTYKHNNKAHIVVQDNGTGMSKEVMDKIFNPFYTTKSEKQGTGLGLSISYGIVHDMKGEIYVESEINKQTTFTVELPLKK